MQLNHMFEIVPQKRGKSMDLRGKICNDLKGQRLTFFASNLIDLAWFIQSLAFASVSFLKV